MLDELRKKSPGLKEAYALWGALIITGLVGLGWLVSVPMRFQAVGPVADMEGQSQTAGAISQFFGQMKEKVVDSWEENKEVVGEIKTELRGQTATSTATTTVSATTTKSGPPVLIGTSSPATVKIGTSTAQ